MPDLGRRGQDSGRGPEESIEAITRSDRLLDALAAQRPLRPADRADAELFALLEDWRDQIRRPGSAALVSDDEAADALREGLAAVQPPKKGSRRGLAVVSSLAAAVLAIGGFGAVVIGAQPGDSLYGLRTSVFGESQQVRDDRVSLVAKTEMAQVQQLIEQGDWEQAQQKLQAVTTQVQQVENVDSKTNLIQQWNELSVKVGTRDPAATLPPVVPGEAPPPAPPGVTLLELPPPVTDTSTTTTTTTSTSTSQPATTSDSPTTSESGTTTSESSTTTPSESTTTGSTPPPSETTSSETTSSEEPVPGAGSPTSVPPTVTSVPSSQVPPAPASESATTTTTAPVITTTTTTTTTVAPAPAAQVPTSVASSAVPSSAITELSEAPPAVVTTTNAPAPRSQAPAIVEEPQDTPAPAAPSHGNNGGNVVTTTVGRPIIQLPIPGFN